MQLHSLRPLPGRVVIRRAESESVTKGGIIIPEQAKEKPLLGTVVAIADGDDPGFVAGDQVLYQKYGGHVVDCDDGDCLVLEWADEVVAVVEPDPIPEVPELTEDEQRALAVLATDSNLPGWSEEERDDPETIEVRRQQTGDCLQDEVVEVGEAG